MPRPPPADPLRAFSREEVEVCVRHAKPRQRWRLVGFAVDLLLLVALALSAPGRRLVAWAAGLAGGFVPGRAALAVTTVVVAQMLVGLPFSVHAHWQDRRAGLATQRLRGFLADWLKSRGVGLVLTVVPVAGLIATAHWRPPGYPWVVAAVGALLVLVVALLGPVVLEPLFNRFEPLGTGPLRERVLALAAELRVPVHDVLVSDASRRTTRVNAYVSGLGRTRRVVVYDTLLADQADQAGAEAPAAAGAGRGRSGPGERSRAREDEVVLVLAHELAHVRHRDVLLGTMVGALATAGGVLLASWLLDRAWLRDWLHVAGLGDPGVAPGLLLLGAIGGLLAAPLASAVSRWSEARADWVALEVSRDPATAVAVERRLALENRADLRPNRLLVALFASHPPTMARIAQAWLWAARDTARDYNRAP
ncbi:MAG TPA: M48 family metalloprotease [Actinomycetota bacterium]|nr:M48 family metalloprotease [Actinomycetota bacterium]